MPSTHARKLALLTLVAALGLATQAQAMGLLIPNEGGPLAIESHRVSIEVNDNLATTRIVEVFRNDSPTQLEATFIFPLPDGATVSDFVLYIDGVATQGEVLEATQARAVYENIVRQVRDPGLVEYIDGRLFQARIFPVPANGTQQVELEFAQVLEREGDLYRLTYPLRTGRTAATTLTDLTLVAEVNTSRPLRTVYSPSHELEVIREGQNRAVVGLEQMHGDLENDFVLYIGQSDEDISINVFSFDEDGPGGEDGYFMMILAPRMEQEDEFIAKDVTFVVDTSGSMAGDKIEQARATLRYCIQQLNENDRFNILRFSTTVRPLFDELRPVSEDSLTDASAFIESISAGGGTAISEALNMALDHETSVDRPHMIIFVTDGLPTVGETRPDAIVTAVQDANNGKGARIFTFGVGYDLDTHLLDLVADQNGGMSDYVHPGEDLEIAVGALYNRISHPVLTNVEIDFGGADVYDTYPSAIPDLFAGNQAVFTGRYTSEANTSITVRGRAQSDLRVYESAQRFDGTEDVANPHDYLPQLWATRKVGFLIDQIRLNGELPELRDEIVSLGTRFGIVTPYTSYLAVAPGEAFNRGGGEPIWEDDWDEEPADLFEGNTDMLFGSGGTSGLDRSGDDDRREDRTPDEATAREPSRDTAPVTAIPGSSGRSGSEAVREAEDVEAQQTQTTAVDNTATQQVGRRTMRLQTNGAWQEDGVDEADERIELSYLSNAYFELLSLRPDLERVLALGERVELLLDDDVALIIGPSGAEALDDEQRARF